ncbi:hypothetical protein CEXT_594481 [Caerostris extrusa]|uniref:Uncharacterized protein n=1 Tax=Caerostris extrusa TaxID=172846 RepID=A0AAV4PVW0_CAEEX|nr:hypothetical protein CEXT_594481 [Caerostris extrusa]
MPLDYRSGWTQERACHPMMGGTLPARLKDHLSVTLSEARSAHLRNTNTNPFLTGNVFEMHTNTSPLRSHNSERRRHK